MKGVWAHSVDVGVFCLALMGTNWIDFIKVCVNGVWAHSVDVGVFCLALMGTNWIDFIKV